MILLWGILRFGDALFFFEGDLLNFFPWFLWHLHIEFVEFVVYNGFTIPQRESFP
jgi:hypothetical protein